MRLDRQEKILPSEVTKPMFWDNLNWSYPVTRTGAPALTSTLQGHRFISRSEFRKSDDIKLSEPMPEVYQRDRELLLDSYRSQTSCDFGTKQPYELERQRFTKPLPCKESHYVLDGHRLLEEVPVKKNAHAMTEMQRAYTTKAGPSTNFWYKSTAQDDDSWKLFDIPPETDNVFVPDIFTDSEGYMRCTDPYASVSRLSHHPFTSEQLDRVPSAPHTVTFYTNANIPRVRGPWPKKRPWWEPAPAQTCRPMTDRTRFKFDAREVRVPNRMAWVPGSLRSETASRFIPPSRQTDILLESGDCELDIDFDMKTISGVHSKPETDLIHSSYSTESSHIGSGKPLQAVLDQKKYNKNRLFRKTIV